jgi:hypothetical protein
VRFSDVALDNVFGSDQINFILSFGLVWVVFDEIPIEESGSRCLPFNMVGKSWNRHRSFATQRDNAIDEKGRNLRCASVRRDQEE